MTTNIKLLPLPEWLLEGFADPTIEMLCDYTRANVEHYVKELQEEVVRVRGLWGDAEILCHKLHDQNAAKDAEIEQLRAEVAHLSRTMGATSHLLESVAAEMDRREARTNRLVEVLQAVVDALGHPLPVMSAGYVYLPERVIRPALDAARAALRDYDQGPKK